MNYEEWFAQELVNLLISEEAQYHKAFIAGYFHCLEVLRGVYSTNLETLLCVVREEMRKL